MKNILGVLIVIWGVALALLVVMRNLPPNPAVARENSYAVTNLYLVSFTVQTEGGGSMTGDISFASDLRTLRDLDLLRNYIASQIENRTPKPIAPPTILNIVKL